MIAAVAHPGQRALLQLLAARLSLCAVYNPWRAAFGRLPVPVYTELPALLAAHMPRVCAFLRPYPGCEKDLATCLDGQVRVLSAGPADLPPSPRWQWGGQHRYSALFLQALAQRRLPAFGEPVYLRRLTGGGTDLLGAWWAACQLLAEARELVGAEPAQVQLAACREGRKHHLVLSVAFANRANAHLVVAPAYFAPSNDLTLLGSGGLVYADSAANAPALVHPGGAQFHPPAFLHPEPAWIQHFAEAQSAAMPPPDAALQRQLLPALRRALRRGLPVQVA